MTLIPVCKPSPLPEWIQGPFIQTSRNHTSTQIMSTLQSTSDTTIELTEQDRVYVPVTSEPPNATPEHIYRKAVATEVHSASPDEINFWNLARNS